MSKTDRSVVRNQAYKKNEFSIRERHNERLNETYYNADIIPEKQYLNVYFKRCEGGYADTFDNMLADGAISVRNLAKDGSAKVFDELVFDVNSEYFERNGGYDYAKSFFEEAYRCAVNEVGGEQYVLSAVMHADERNKALSEQLGRDVFHYHLHVLYIPVVDKEVLWTKRCKDPALVGTVKEVIKQVSHSKKWPRFKTDKGWVNSYSLLQDRYHEHMKNAGFIGLERGERGSTAEHLTVLEYKTQQETERAAAMTAVVADMTQTATDLDVETERKKKRLDYIDEKISVKTKAAATIAEVEAMGKPALLGGFNVSADEMGKLKTLAKKGVAIHDNTKELKRKLTAAEGERDDAKKQLTEEIKKRPSIKEHMTWWDKFMTAMRRAPKRLMAVIEEILREQPERQVQQRTVPERKQSRSAER